MALRILCLAHTPELGNIHRYVSDTGTIEESLLPRGTPAPFSIHFNFPLGIVCTFQGFIPWLLVWNVHAPLVSQPWTTRACAARRLGGLRRTWCCQTWRRFALQAGWLAGSESSAAASRGAMSVNCEDLLAQIIMQSWSLPRGVDGREW